MFDDVALYAATSPEDIATAFRLSGVGRNTRLLDLGCGDGQVLAAACEVGALAFGVECDPRLAARARQRTSGSTAVIDLGDFFRVDLRQHRPDVVFAFLTHAVLQSLAFRLHLLDPGTQLATVQMRVPGYVPIRSESGIFVYRLPALRAVVKGSPGWRLPGLAACLPADRPSVTSFLIVHPSGPVHIEATGSLEPSLLVRCGADFLGAPGELGIDLVWSPRPDGTAVTGALASHAVGVLPVIAFYSQNGPFGTVPFDLSAEPIDG
ncbi:class I SAM-dependent methyltransferase [Mycobacterium intracellulare]|uniref:class I SAM-dependent methyltransferase n=1 Tax=Mycobacterium intracellulare TaxID=1767 RepID=UPI00352913D2